MFPPKTRSWLAVAASLLSTQPATAQRNTTDFTTWFPVTEFPNAQAANVSYWQAQAQETAGWDLYAAYQARCVMTAQKYPEIGSSTDGFIAPARPFDSVFFVGQAFVSAWAIDTGDGLILIDALWNTDEVKKILLPGLEAFGYTGSDVKALIVTHEHLDHYGGATYMQSEFGVPVYAAEEAWDALESDQTAPERDRTVGDGDVVQVGNTTVTVVKTPGHTPGTISLIFPLRDRGEEHMAGLFGGLGISRDPEGKAVQIQSFRKFGCVARKRGVDVFMANHLSHDMSATNLDVLANRECDESGCSLSNPYVVGTERYARYMKLMEMCVRLKAAREGEDLRL